ncbi:DUF4149 domain-containing protein [Aspergillus glaucus CBS 516.65]|uniref:TMEM205-like domain-containing protein n=1 Tax=Aspergillus glaucus CBS 516.65 TaxID=1160497 RepID=A0A1L9V658_ASPGL|nr:hypothetical protein ASPGLDRAFT_61839 [Aspergillus glaucus CBS 516.65]OJJ79415.1 hypothetical protein ASPGLDRAFT_61839 [Aspergillus glaucus CBS 516.65]
MTDPRPYHVLSYGTLLGVQVYQSFVSGVVAFRALPRPQFAQLQTATFPIYFTLQSALPVVVALTASKGGQTLGVSGLLAPENRLNTLLPMATAVVTGLANQFILRPLTMNVMKERKKQETRDGKKSYDPPPHSKQMQALNKKFGKVHGVSSLLNLATLLATVYYGVVIGKQLS